MTTTGGGVASLTLPDGLSGTCKDILGREGFGGAGVGCGCDVIEGIEKLFSDCPLSTPGAETGGVQMGATGSSGVVVVVVVGNGGREASIGVLFIGGRPRGLTPPLGTPGLHAEDTFLGPLRCVVSLGLDGVTADCGSRASSQKDLLEFGVIADCGQRNRGVC